MKAHRTHPPAIGTSGAPTSLRKPGCRTHARRLRTNASRARTTVAGYSAIGAVVARRQPSRTLASGTVAAAIPPITRTTPSNWVARGRFAEKQHAQTDGDHGLGQQDDRGDDRRQAWQRDRDEQIPGRLRGHAEQDEPDQAAGRWRQVEVADQAAGRKAGNGDHRGRDRHEPGRSIRVATGAPDRQQEPGVADGRCDAEHDPEGRISPVRRAADHARRSGRPRPARRGVPPSVARDGRSPSTSQATSPTRITWRLPRTVASPAPTASIA